MCWFDGLGLSDGASVVTFIGGPSWRPFEAGLAWLEIYMVGPAQSTIGPDWPERPNPFVIR